MCAKPCNQVDCSSRMSRACVITLVSELRPLDVVMYPTLALIIECYSENATEAWHRHERHRTWHTQKQQP